MSNLRKKVFVKFVNLLSLSIFKKKNSHKVTDIIRGGEGKGREG